MRIPHIRLAALAAISGIALGGCAYDMYGDPYGYGYGGYGGYGGGYYGGYGYGRYGGYGSGYGGYGYGGYGYGTATTTRSAGTATIIIRAPASTCTTASRPPRVERATSALLEHRQRSGAPHRQRPTRTVHHARTGAASTARLAQPRLRHDVGTGSSNRSTGRTVRRRRAQDSARTVTVRTTTAKLARRARSAGAGSGRSKRRSSRRRRPGW